MKSIELLAPARDLETGLAAVNCGADAVYIGAARFGARQEAGNPLREVEQLISYAHRYWARVYVTVNTLLHDEELPEALQLIRQVYEAGADALIIQDVGLLECDLPPIPLIASTQMHNHSPEKVAFLEKVGFRRAILARELSLEEIRSIRSQTSIELETFVHGALCVCYSGQCYLSYAIGGRSGNRGQCAQPCRRSYSLLDSRGRTLIRDRYLLSLRDMNQTAHLGDLLAAGVSAFKIEGRLKDKAYVMNVVAHYRRELDSILEGSGLQKSSSGHSQPGFEPDVRKTFNRGYSTYFLNGRGAWVESTATPKMTGEAVGKVLAVSRNSFTLGGGTSLHNGDGICFVDHHGNLQGTMVNRAEGNVIFPLKMEGIEKGLQIQRNHDHAFLTGLDKSKPLRKIDVSLVLSETPDGYRLEIEDQDGVIAAHEITCAQQEANKPEMARSSIEKQLTSLGGTEFACTRLEIKLDRMPFIPVAELNQLRRGAVETLCRERQAHISQDKPKGIVPNSHPYPEKELNYRGNALNQKAVVFYRRHGVTKIEPAAESGLDMHGRKVMTTRYCLKYQLGNCPREHQPALENEPLFLVDENGQRLHLKFDCKACLMEIIYE
jgi:23S rRNA 5-hydroxycytidine C2501 synthase